MRASAKDVGELARMAGSNIRWPGTPNTVLPKVLDMQVANILFCALQQGYAPPPPVADA